MAVIRVESQLEKITFPVGQNRGAVAALHLCQYREAHPTLAIRVSLLNHPSQSPRKSYEMPRRLIDRLVTAIPTPRYEPSRAILDTRYIVGQLGPVRHWIEKRMAQLDES